MPDSSRRLAASLFVVLATVPLGGAVFAQQRQVPAARQEINLSFAPVVKSTSASVVNVYGARVEKRPQNPLMDDPFFRRFFGGGDGAPRERVQRSLGSGVVVDASGLVVTNNHVIENMSEVKVAFADKREVEATILLRDPRTDLAVLKLTGAKDLKPLELADSDSVEIGDLVLASRGLPGQRAEDGVGSLPGRLDEGLLPPLEHAHLIVGLVAAEPLPQAGARERVEGAGRAAGEAAAPRRSGPPRPPRETSPTSPRSR